MSQSHPRVLPEDVSRSQTDVSVPEVPEPTQPRLPLSKATGQGPPRGAGCRTAATYNGSKLLSALEKEPNSLNK